MGERDLARKRVSKVGTPMVDPILWIRKKGSVGARGFRDPEERVEL